MKKRVFAIVMLFLFLNFMQKVCASEVNQAKNLFLYLYTPQCGYCTKFNANFQKLAQAYGEKYNFVKVDATTQSGKSLMRNYRAFYVPFVLISDTKKSKSIQIAPDCLLSYACVEGALNVFTH